MSHLPFAFDYLDGFTPYVCMMLFFCQCLVLVVFTCKQLILFTFKMTTSLLYYRDFSLLFTTFLYPLITFLMEFWLIVFFFLSVNISVGTIKLRIFHWDESPHT